VAPAEFDAIGRRTAAAVVRALELGSIEARIGSGAGAEPTISAFERESRFCVLTGDCYEVHRTASGYSVELTPVHTNPTASQVVRKVHETL
jgi:hypothetical protein